MRAGLLQIPSGWKNLKEAYRLAWIGCREKLWYRSFAVGLNFEQVSQVVAVLFRWSCCASQRWRKGVDIGHQVGCDPGRVLAEIGLKEFDEEHWATQEAIAYGHGAAWPVQ